MRNNIKRNKIDIERGDLVMFDYSKYLVIADIVNCKPNEKIPIKLLDIHSSCTLTYEFSSIEELRECDRIKLLAKSNELVLKIIGEI